jgi:nucleoside-diphosphate-sugar epimerase
MMFKTIKRRVVPITGLVFSMCYVQDAVDAAIQLAESAAQTSVPCTVSDGEVHDYQEFSEVCEELLGIRALHVRVPPGLVTFAAWWSEKLSAEMPILNRDKARELTCTSWVCSNERLRACTGFQPRFDLRAGLKLTIDWYRRNGWL